jgi:hypothetical protein
VSKSHNDKKNDEKMGRSGRLSRWLARRWKSMATGVKIKQNDTICT